MKLANLYEQVTNKIIAELETGAVPWTRPWKYQRTGSIMPQNFATGRPYSGINIPILWGEAIARGYDRHQWLTFKQARMLKASVRKGEHGTVVVFTRKLRVGDEDETKLVSMLRTYSVFNVAQVDDLLEELAKPDAVPEPDRMAAVDAFVGATKAEIRTGDNQPMYVPSQDFIAMPALGQFRNANHYYATLLHECGHWSGAEKRLNRDLRNRFGTKAYAAEELIAEFAAAFLCAHLGIEESFGTPATSPTGSRFSGKTITRSLRRHRRLPKPPTFSGRFRKEAFMPKPREYEFTLPDGSKRYEIVDPECWVPILKQIAMFKKMHGAVSARPVKN